MGKFISSLSNLFEQPGIFDLLRGFPVTDASVGRLDIVALDDEHLVIHMSLAGQVPSRAAVDVIAAGRRHPLHSLLLGLWREIGRWKSRLLRRLGRNHRKGGRLLMAVHLLIVQEQWD